MSPRRAAALALLLAAAPAAASDLGVPLSFPSMAMKRAVSGLPDTGDSEPLEKPLSALLLSGEAAAGSVGAELSVDGGEWRGPAAGEVDEDGDFWFRFDGRVPAGARVRLRFVPASGAPPAWVLVRGAEGVEEGARSLSLAEPAAPARRPSLGGAPAGAGPPAPAVRPRADWGARPAADPYELMIPGGISVHHTETAAPHGAEGAARMLRSIQSFHQHGRGWSDIAYHYVIDVDGRVWEGRPGPVLGAHVKDRNDGNIGISLMGDFETGQPSAAQLESLAALASWLSWRYGIPSTRLLGHRQQERTACPGAALYARLGQVRAEVDARLAAAAAAGAGPRGTARR